LGGAMAIAALIAFLEFRRRSQPRKPSSRIMPCSPAPRRPVGDDLLSWQESTAALALQPMHRDALRLAVASYFNRLVLVGPHSWRRADLERNLCALPHGAG
jgi:hypothetical protein